MWGRSEPPSPFAFFNDGATKRPADKMTGEGEVPPQLGTARMQMLPWSSGDWLQLKPIAQDSEVMRYISTGQTWPDERIGQFVERQIACYAQRGFCLWRLLEKISGEMIGFCGLQPLEGAPDIEIGWWLACSRWGKGLATEAAREALRDGFGRVGLQRIVAIAQPENRSSIRVMEKLGMSFERETTRKGIRVALYTISKAAHATKRD